MWYKNFEEFKKQFELHKPEIDEQVRGSHRTDRRNTCLKVAEKLVTSDNLVIKLLEGNQNIQITKLGEYCKNISKLELKEIHPETKIYLDKDINSYLKGWLVSGISCDWGCFKLIEISTGEVFAFNYNHIESPLLTYLEVVTDPDIFYIWHNEIRITEGRYWEN